MPEIGPMSGELDINIEDNVDFSMPVIYKIAGTPVDVTGYTATFTLVDHEGDTSTPELTLTEAAGITVGGVDGTFTVSIDSTQAVFGNREMFYDLVVVTPTAVPVRLLRGKCSSHARAKQ